jgi:hypothetical protein
MQENVAHLVSISLLSFLCDTGQVLLSTSMRVQWGHRSCGGMSVVPPPAVASIKAGSGALPPRSSKGRIYGTAANKAFNSPRSTPHSPQPLSPFPCLSSHGKLARSVLQRGKSPPACRAVTHSLLGRRRRRDLVPNEQRRNIVGLLPRWEAQRSTATGRGCTATHSCCMWEARARFQLQFHRRRRLMV